MRVVVFGATQNFSKMTRHDTLVVVVLSLAAIYTVYCAPLNNTESPILVHVLFRHGHRTSYRFYPTDPYINHTFYPIGRGGLTNKGKLTVHSLGELLRKEYGNLLGDYYTPDIIHLRTTDTIRTRFSAQLVVTGLWPPTGEQKWHPTINWQPVAIEVKSSAEEDLLEFSACKLRNKLIDDLAKNQTAYDIYLSPHKELITYVEQNSGLHIKDLRDLITIYFTLKTEHEANLDLPEWTKKIFPDALKAATIRTYEYLTFDPLLKKFHTGYLLKKWIDDSNAKINNALNPPERKMFLYSAHESTLGYILTILNATDVHVPDYGSAIIVELHKKEENHVFRFRYIRSPSEENIEDLTLPDCGVYCSVEQFTSKYQHLIPTTSFWESCKIEAAVAA